MKSIDLGLIEKNGKVLLLAYDQGFEHGPIDFNEKNIDPAYVVDIAQKGPFTGFVVQEGIAARYINKDTLSKPLIVKLNGKTSFQSEEPYSPQLCTVERAIALGATGVGYTIYVGSQRESEMMKEFSRIEDEAHAAGLIVISWMYPRGASVKGKESDREIVAYAARLGLELNADLVKVPYPGNLEALKWVVTCAGKTGVLVQGGGKKPWAVLEEEVKTIMDSGAKGLAIGRNIWQAEKPFEIAENLSKLVFSSHV